MTIDKSNISSPLAVKLKHTNPMFAEAVRLFPKQFLVGIGAEDHRGQAIAGDRLGLHVGERSHGEAHVARLFVEARMVVDQPDDTMAVLLPVMPFAQQS